VAAASSASSPCIAMCAKPLHVLVGSSSLHSLGGVEYQCHSCCVAAVDLILSGTKVGLLATMLSCATIHPVHTYGSALPCGAAEEIHVGAEGKRCSCCTTAQPATAQLYPCDHSVCNAPYFAAPDTYNHSRTCPQQHLPSAQQQEPTWLNSTRPSLVTPAAHGPATATAATACASVTHSTPLPMDLRTQ
jgi:hypothetical protein